MEADQKKATDQKKVAWHDRSAIPVLIVFNNHLAAAKIKGVMSALGFSRISNVNTHVAALQRLRQRTYPLVVFDAEPSDMPTVEFAAQAFDLDSDVILLPISKNPRVDDVFSMLRVGARGFVVEPYTMGSVEIALSRAQDGPPLSDAVLQAVDRNSAFVGVILHALYRLCLLMHMANKYQKAASDCAEQRAIFRESVELAKIFCEGTHEDLRDNIIDACIRRANTAATRLGRTRRKLKAKREVGDELVDDDATD